MYVLHNTFLAAGCVCDSNFHIFSVIQLSSHIFQPASKWVASARKLSGFSTLKIVYCLTRKCCASMFFGFTRSWFKGNSSSTVPVYNYLVLPSFSQHFSRKQELLYFWVRHQPTHDTSPYADATTDALILSGLALLIFNSDTLIETGKTLVV